LFFRCNKANPLGPKKRQEEKEKVGDKAEKRSWGGGGEQGKKSASADVSLMRRG